jgi:hypothetical protein
MDGGVSVAAPRPLRASAGLDVTEIGVFEGAIVGVWTRAGSVVVATDRGAWVDGRRVAGAPGGGRALGFSRAGRPVLACLDGGALRLFDLRAAASVPFGLAVAEVAGTEGGIAARAGAQVLGVVLHDVGASVVASTSAVANVLPHATRLYDGVAFQDLLGAAFATLLPGGGAAFPCHLRELDGATVVDARHERGVLGVVSVRGGVYSRHVFRFHEDFSRYETWRRDDVALAAVNFAVVASGLCVLLNEDEDLELFASRYGTADRRTVRSDLLGDDLRLYASQGVLFTRGDRLFRVTLAARR